MFSRLHKIFDSLTKSERQIFTIALAIFIIAALSLGVYSFFKNTVIAPVQGGGYAEGVVGQPISLNPLIAQSREIDQDLVTLLFANLADLMESYKQSDDFKTWTITFKQNLTWSDGEPLTSDDLIFTLQAIQNPETESWLRPAWQGVSVERLSERAARLTLKAPYAFFFDTLQTLRIVPQHIFSKIPLANIRLSVYNFEPVGSGPYKFSRYEKRKDGFVTAYDLVTNQRYEGDQPLIKNFSFKFFSETKEAIQAFNERMIDGLGGLINQDLATISVSHQVFEIAMPRYYTVFFNPKSAPALKNKEIRHALSLATDREDIIRTVLGGKATLTLGPIYPHLEGFSSETYQDPSFNLQKAQDTLSKQGFKPNDENVQTQKSGDVTTTLDFEIVVPDIPFLIETANALKNEWQKIGVRLTLLVTSPADVVNNYIKTRNYQMILYGNILKNNPDIFSFWHSSEEFYPGLNLALYENKNVDSLLESVRIDFDPTSRQKELTKIQESIRDDYPAVFLFSPSFLYIAPKNLGGMKVTFMSIPAERFSKITKWFLKTARVFK